MTSNGKVNEDADDYAQAGESRASTGGGIGQGKYSPTVYDLLCAATCGRQSDENGKMMEVTQCASPSILALGIAITCVRTSLNIQT